MKSLMFISVAALGLCAATPAFAQHVTPAGTTFSATGPAMLNGTPCTLTLNADTNSTGTGGTITGGTNAPPCASITIDAGATYTVDSYNPAGNGSASGTLNGLVVRAGGMVACTQTAPITFAINNNAPGAGSRIVLSGTVGTCTVAANIATPTVRAAP